MSALGRGNILARAAEGVRLAIDAIQASRTRAMLAILGIAIGVMVVIAMASAITGIQNSVTEIVQRAGSSSFYVMRYFQAGITFERDNTWRQRPALTREDADLIRTLPGIGAVTVMENSGSRAVSGTEQLASVRVRATDVTWLDVEGGKILDGRTFSTVESGSGAFVAVINERAAELLFGQRDPIGRRVKLFGLPFTVIGLYENPQDLFSDTPSPQFIIPHPTYVKVGNPMRWGLEINVAPAAGVSTQEAMDQVTVALRIKRGLKPGQENNFDLIGGDRFLDSFNNISRGFFLVMLALSSVGLMVGGVGVIAIMMISVTERTREIGIRKALGATRGEILFQFLVESATLTVIGGMIGMALGGMIAWLIATFTPIPAAVPLWSIGAALAASTITGICFGLYPANRAARLDPVGALAYE